ncbi:hypothetical protein, variant 1 [Aphanomyces astaci]|uniref:Peptidase M14 domain-containing protein n=1 Tax=Aphanomyces astaci TaxID=112090 RepID=W4FTH6_APHAT|nr:hypothetical protein, variant 1 [Aphanomyces astaci]ETV70241.1 hypothetical protein, variant 1 [Aphanomyces astaci]|eukprot:XP_009840336.1 hypothetical protein, variant 1 [Aphanomyces astaci]
MIPHTSLVLGLVAAFVRMADGSGGAAATSFLYRTYQEMVQTMKALNTSYPDVVDLFVAQDVYGLPYPPELQCEEDAEGVAVPCKQYVLRITNESTLDADRPEVFISGALHGNERVGPQATIELALLLVEYATTFTSSSVTSDTDHVRRSKAWLHRLVNTRAIYMMPMTNAHGYFHNKREEGKIDPNRDYNYKTDGNCMQAMTSRAVNELWRDHLFQLAVTFHGGMRCVTYEWGAPNHMQVGAPQVRSERSPDDTSQVQLGSALSTFAGKFADGSNYPTGTMNDVVYGVYGGMEDWAYAASWENSFGSDSDSIFTPCTPTQYGPYPAHKTTYNNKTHRAFNILVETSDLKRPAQTALGLRSSLYDVDLQALADDPVGHVPQNVRLALLLIDMVQPYVVLLPHDDSVVVVNDPLTGCPASSARHVIDCDDQHSCTVTNTTTHVRVRWEVLGSFTVDETFVQVSPARSFQSVLDATLEMQRGWTRRQHDVAPTLFAACVPISSTHASLFIRVVAKVDQNWASQQAPASPAVPPQSHLVNARTNAQYNMDWNGHRIQGTLYFYSPVITVSRLNDVSDISNNSNRSGRSIHTGM